MVCISAFAVRKIFLLLSLVRNCKKVWNHWSTGMHYIILVKVRANMFVLHRDMWTPGTICLPVFIVTSHTCARIRQCILLSEAVLASNYIIQWLYYLSCHFFASRRRSSRTKKSKKSISNRTTQCDIRVVS